VRLRRPRDELRGDSRLGGLKLAWITRRNFSSITQRSTVSGEQMPPSRQIKLGSDLYTEASAAMSLPPGKHWVHEKEGGGKTTGEANPARLLDYLRKWATDVSIVGRRSFRGIPTTVYRAKIDLRAAVEDELETLGWTDAAIEQFLGQELNGPASLEVSIGRDGLIRKIVLSSTSNGDQETETLELSDFGVRVAAEPPAARTVVDFANA